MFVGGDVLDDAVFVCGTVAVQQIGAVTSEHFVRSVALMLRVMMALALSIRLPSVAATSHRVAYKVMELQFFVLRTVFGCGICMIHWVELYREPREAGGR